MNAVLEKGTNFIWENARLLERVIFDFRFRDGLSTRILQTLRAYQNADGGFGHALEPDLRAPDSHPLFTEFALRTLYDCKLRDAGIALRCADFLAQHADLERGIPPIFPTSRLYPRAAHWDNPLSEQPSVDRLTSLVGLVNWQHFEHPWLKEAVEVCLQYIRTTLFDDAHTIHNAFCLLESVAEERSVDELFNKLAEELFASRFFCLDVPVKTYGLTPLTFAPSPNSYCQGLFSDAQIEAHLDDLEAHQQADGGWPITWEPPGKTALWEWRANWTLAALTILHAYDRI
jgi:hypothetical protein